jgi:drug/metabolite transporter (DMT)-like permease
MAVTRPVPPTAPAAARPTLTGIAFALLTVTIWGGWIATTRLAVTTELTPWDAGFLRFLAPSLVLAPVLLRHGLGFDRLGPWGTLALVAGAGAPFFLVSVAGMRYAPAAHAGALLPGTMPLFVALFAALALGERFSRIRLAGFGLIGAGVLTLGAWEAIAGDGAAWRGHLLFLSGAALWAVFTVTLRRAGMGAWHAAALVNTYSLAGFAPVYVLWLEPRLLSAPMDVVALQAIGQGVLSGLIAMWAFGEAVRRLGAPRAAAFSALAPAIAALFAIPLLDEWPSPATLAGIAAVGTGVTLASGTLRRRNDP